MWATASLLLGRQLDHVVDSQNGDGRLGGELQALDLGHGRLEYASGAIVANLSLHQVETVPLRLED